VLYWRSCSGCTAVCDTAGSAPCPKTGVPLGNGHYTISHRIGPHIDQFGADVNHFYFDQYLEVRGQDSRPVASHVASWVRSFWQPYFDNALPKSFLVVLHPGDADWRMVSPRRAANDAIQSFLLAQLPVSCLAVALESWGGLTASSTQRLARYSALSSMSHTRNRFDTNDAEGAVQMVRPATAYADKPEAAGFSGLGAKPAFAVAMPASVKVRKSLRFSALIACPVPFFRFKQPLRVQAPGSNRSSIAHGHQAQAPRLLSHSSGTAGVEFTAFPKSRVFFHPDVNRPK